jgi:hypothetical protein
MEPIKGDRGPRGLRGLPGSSFSPSVKIAFVILTLVFFLTVVGFMKVVIDVRNLSEDSIKQGKNYIRLTKENKRLINEIQKSRISSCKKTYDGIKEVVHVSFFRNRPLTEERKIFLIKFDKIITDFKKGCTTHIKSLK